MTCKKHQTGSVVLVVTLVMSCMTLLVISDLQAAKWQLKLANQPWPVLQLHSMS